MQNRIEHKNQPRVMNFQRGQGFVSLSLFNAGSRETELKIKEEPSRHFYLPNVCLIPSKIHYFPTTKVLHKIYPFKNS